MANPTNSGSSLFVEVEHVKNYEKMNTVNKYLMKKQEGNSVRQTTRWNNQVAWYNPQFKAFNIQTVAQFDLGSHQEKVGIKVQEDQTQFTVHVNNQAGNLTEGQQGLVDHLFRIILQKRLDQAPREGNNIVLTTWK